MIPVTDVSLHPPYSTYLIEMKFLSLDRATGSNSISVP